MLKAKLNNVKAIEMLSAPMAFTLICSSIFHKGEEGTWAATKARCHNNKGDADFLTPLLLI